MARSAVEGDSASDSRGTVSVRSQCGQSVTRPASEPAARSWRPQRGQVNVTSGWGLGIGKQATGGENTPRQSQQSSCPAGLRRRPVRECGYSRPWRALRGRAGWPGERPRGLRTGRDQTGADGNHAGGATTRRARRSVGGGHRRFRGKPYCSTRTRHERTFRPPSGVGSPPPPSNTEQCRGLLAQSLNGLRCDGARAESTGHESADRTSPAGPSRRRRVRPRDGRRECRTTFTGGRCS